MKKLAVALFALSALPLAAQPSPWGERDRVQRGSARGATDREGKVSVSTFVAQGAATLGSGAIVVTQAPGFSAAPGEREAATYEAAVLDALGKAGYAISAPRDEAAQQIELRITRDVAVPEEQPRKPVSGEMSMGVSNHGSMMGLGLHLDLTKPRKAMIATRLEARIRDRASGALLWEGRADILTRDGSRRWDEQAIASKLAAELFARFPQASD